MSEWKCEALKGKKAVTLRQFRKKVLLAASGLVEGHWLQGHEVSVCLDPTGRLVVFRCDGCEKSLLGEGKVDIGGSLQEVIARR